VQFAPFATPQGAPGPGRGPTAELVSAVSERLHSCLRPLHIPKQLCIKPGSGAYAVEADIYVLNADGAVFDAVFLAALVMLRDLALPPTKEVASREDKPESTHAAGEAVGGGTIRALTNEEAAAAGVPPVRLLLPLLPLAVTCCMYKEHLLVDPTSEEEGVSGSTVTVVLDASATLHGASLQTCLSAGSVHSRWCFYIQPYQSYSSICYCQWSVVHMYAQPPCIDTRACVCMCVRACVDLVCMCACVYATYMYIRMCVCVCLHVCARTCV